ncbi:UNVERIFIED_CONTAM: Receptor-like serine/threonine-protein kinase NCRK [Sesamum radiatum]|uniref:Receptor-like serine/threonine-protein kinase NCRK n=1 Tax=Sesamum radiatum TaxID=300843 RepID=A0AAW2UM99_SESRA
MKLQVDIALLCIINVVWIQQALSDGLSTKPEANKWTCTCSIAHQENLNFVPANCSSSCDCSPAAGGSSEKKWTCICSAGGLPRLVGEDNDSSCFSACNCNAGTLSELEPSKKRISSKVVVIVLLLCLVLVVLAFVASVLWHVNQKDKRSVQWASPSTDKLTSCSSATNLMSQAGSPLPVYKGYLDSSVKLSLGCIPKSSFRFRSRGGAVHGTIIQFPYSELESATNRFSDANLIGVGGSSHVYRGNLRDGRTVAIKRMKTQGGPDAERDFLTEIELISRLHHCHVVPLLGYCSAHQGKHAERLLVFEYIPNGNLRECLDGDLGQCLDWNTRVAIALGAARGLEYLHEAAAPRILHRDVKSTNILLDEKWRAKATPRLHDSKRVIGELPDPRLKGNFQDEEMQVMAYLAKECLLLDPDSRPSMTEVVQILSTIAPNKSKRKHLPIHAFQCSSTGGMETGNPETSDGELEEIKQITSEIPARCSLRTTPDSNFDATKSKKEADDSSTSIEQLMLLSSKSRSWRLQDDEVVDITEPRVEGIQVKLGVHQRTLPYIIGTENIKQFPSNGFLIQNLAQDTKSEPQPPPSFTSPPPHQHPQRLIARRGMAGKSSATPTTYSPSLSGQKKKRPSFLTESDWVRPDGRGPHQCRPAFLRTGAVNSASGSAYAEFGNTKVIVSVFGPRESKKAMMYSDTGRLNCNVSYTTFATPIRGQAPETKDLSSMLHKALEGAIILKSFPKTTVDVFALVLESGGSDLPVITTCASLALADAGIMYMTWLPLFQCHVLGRISSLTLYQKKKATKTEAMQLCLDACSKLGKIMRSCLKEAASGPQD